MTSPAGIGLDFATLISYLNRVYTSISLVLFGGTVWALTHGRPKDEINWSMVLVAINVIGSHGLIVGFISKAGPFPGGPTRFFADVTQQTFIIKYTVYVLQTLLGDGVIIYRCYVVWQSFRVILLPAVLWCAAFATSTVVLYKTSHAMEPDFFMVNFGKWVAIFYALTMTTNLLGSGLLAYRIWMIDRDTSGVVRVPPRSGVTATLLLRVLIDAAVLYTLALIALLLCYAFQSIGQLVLVDMVPPIISIAFYTVLVRIAIAKNNSSRVHSDALSPLRFARVTPSPSEPRVSDVRRSSV
ncbi:hypothetical protein EV363DRAFT_1432674 [Boletus edulis]|nr:hypothetical protein EV363DRAFT_1432674 [Boletus edulis]